MDITQETAQKGGKAEVEAVLQVEVEVEGDILTEGIESTEEKEVIVIIQVVGVIVQIIEDLKDIDINIEIEKGKKHQEEKIDILLIIVIEVEVHLLLVKIVEVEETHLIVLLTLLHLLGHQNRIKNIHVQILIIQIKNDLMKI